MLRQLLEDKLGRGTCIIEGMRALHMPGRGTCTIERVLCVWRGWMGG